ncbi:MAG: hypothetical protein KBT48_03175 [Firmicutes bacterium]|nr:hypothetical protein [Bacillota bacterium]
MQILLDNCRDTIPYLKQGYVLIVVENKTIVALRENGIFLQNENWHTTMKLEDYMELFENNTFVVYENKEFEIGNDEEYYKWRAKYL